MRVVEVAGEPVCRDVEVVDRKDPGAGTTSSPTSASPAASSESTASRPSAATASSAGTGRSRKKARTTVASFDSGSSRSLRARPRRRRSTRRPRAARRPPSRSSRRPQRFADDRGSLLDRPRVGRHRREIMPIRRPRPALVLRCVSSTAARWFDDGGQADPTAPARTRARLPRSRRSPAATCSPAGPSRRHRRSPTTTTHPRADGRPVLQAELAAAALDHSRGGGRDPLDAHGARAHDGGQAGRAGAPRLLAASAAGVYDNRGYRFRGHQFTDANGRYALTTVVPGPIPASRRHIHVKV